MKICFLNADEQQAKKIAHIQSESWRRAYAEIIPPRELAQHTYEPNRAARLFSHMMSGLREYHLIQVDGYDCGMLSLGRCRDRDGDGYGEIIGLYLLPDFLRQGIGTQAMEFALQRLREMGFTHVRLWVFEENVTARTFYKKMGFYHDGTIRELSFGRATKVMRYCREI